MLAENGIAAGFAARVRTEQYISLTTFRRDGRPVSTPVWFAVDGDRLVVWSAATSGKIKRLRHARRVTVAPCDIRGRVTGEVVEGVGVLLPASEGKRAQNLLDRRYGLTKQLYSAVMRIWNHSILRRPAVPAAYIEISFPAVPPVPRPPAAM